MLEQAVAKNPTDWVAMADLAVGYMKLGQHSKAKSLARRAKRRAPSDHEVMRQVAFVLGLTSKSHSALRKGFPVQRAVSAAASVTGSPLPPWWSPVSAEPLAAHRSP